jgi:hypothetical protein
MILTSVTYRREPTADIPETTYVGMVNGLPYHVMPSDPLYPLAQQMGVDAPLEPPLPPLPVVLDPKMIGIEFDGVMCSATGLDQNGLNAVFTAIQVQGAAFPATRFKFDNGNELVITAGPDGNYQAFMDVWLPFRQSFFLAAP